MNPLDANTPSELNGLPEVNPTPEQFAAWLKCSYWAFYKGEQLVTCGSKFGLSLIDVMQKALTYSGVELRLLDKSPMQKHDVGPYFGMTWEQLQARQQKKSV